jgi:hypothetical protein
MKHLFTMMIMVLALLWGLSISSNAQTCPSGPGCPGQNWCCPPEGCAGFPDTLWGKARCATGSFTLPAGACCLDGSFYPNDACACNQPPDCSNAAADPDYLWPPNHNFVEISVVGVTDPDGDPITITIDDISQDEATETALGAGNFCPDADGVRTTYAYVRAERSGNKNVPGDGRVYSIDFTADDGYGGACSGTVLVCVPHDRADGCVDGGPLYDSTACN